MNEQAVKKLAILRYSKIFLPALLLITAYLFIGYLFYPHPAIPTKIEGAAASNPYRSTLPSPTISPTPIPLDPSKKALLDSISNTPTAGASSSVTLIPVRMEN